MKEIKIFEFNNCDWVAAKNLRDAVRELEGHGFQMRREILESFTKVLSEKDLKNYVFIEDVYNQEDSKKYSFKTRLKKLIKNGEKFPQMFATSEY